MVLEMEQSSSSNIVAQSTRKKVKLHNLIMKEKFCKKVEKPFLKLLKVRETLSQV